MASLLLWLPQRQTLVGVSPTQYAVIRLVWCLATVIVLIGSAVWHERATHAGLPRHQQVVRELRRRRRAERLRKSIGVR